MITNWWIQYESVILTSLLSSFIFLFAIFVVFRPYFYISKKISFSNEVYRFKIINLTLSKTIDFKVFARIGVLSDAYPSGHDFHFKELKMNSDGFIYVDGLIKGLFSSKRPNCIQIKAAANQDLKMVLQTDGNYIDLIVIGKHGKTNLQTTKLRTFKHVRRIKDGMFESGITTKISKS